MLCLILKGKHQQIKSLLKLNSLNKKTEKEKLC